MSDLVRYDGPNLKGAQKAAVLMLALGEEHCSRLFAMMHEDEIKDISSAMAQLGAIRSDMVERVCAEFMDTMGTSGNLVGSFESTEHPQPSPHFFSCDSKAVGLDAKSPRHLQREAGPTDRVIPRVT